VPGEKLNVFISYSRSDLTFADELASGLEVMGFATSIDRHMIREGEDWQQRLSNLIADAGTVVFILSPDSAQSPICAWEVEEAAHLAKRILPVLWRPLQDMPPPQKLAALNYVRFDEGRSFMAGLKALAKALTTDLDWLNEHARLFSRATEWERGENRLLSGSDIAEARAWAFRRPRNAPELTNLHIDYIRTSEAAEHLRSNSEARRLAEISAAQDQRAHALATAEAAQKERAAALEQAARHQKSRAKAQKVIVGVSVLSSLLFACLVGFVLLVRERNRQNTDYARAQYKEVQLLMDSAATLAAYALVEFGRQPVWGTYAVDALESCAKSNEYRCMAYLYIMYDLGRGVPQDRAKAQIWYGKAVEKGGELDTMQTVGDALRTLKHEPTKYARSHALYEKVATGGNPNAKAELAKMYAQGLGVSRDFSKARHWAKEAQDEALLKRIVVDETLSLGRYGEAVKLQQAIVGAGEGVNTSSEIANANLRMAWISLLARDYAQALAAAERALSKDPQSSLFVDALRAQALMLLDRTEEARALFLANKGKTMGNPTDPIPVLWEELISDCFVRLRAAGLDHPLMSEVERTFAEVERAERAWAVSDRFP
jgi:TPR repeat protein